MKKERFREVLDALEALEEMLRKYCHAEECDAIYSCPADCEECAKKLGLDTAIAWQLADRVRVILDCVEVSREQTLLLLEKYVPIVDAFGSVVARHMASFPQLDDLVDETRTALMELWDLLEEA